MPVTVQIDGVGKVQLDDSFKGLSAADQQATVDEIATQHASTQPSSPRPSMLESGIRSAANAATFNLMPMIAAAGDATIPLDSSASKAPGWMQRYKENLDAQDAQDRSSQTVHPGAAITGSIAGGLINPVTRALPLAKTLGGAIGQGAAIGAGYGAGAGISNQDDLGGIAKEAALGGVIGGAIPAALPAAGAALRGAGKGAAALLGNVTTGAGSNAVTGAFKAGVAGGDQSAAFLSNMRGDTPWSDVVDQAKTALGKMRADRNAAYRSGMADISKDATILDFKPVDEALGKASSVKTFKGQDLSPKTADVRKEIEDTIAEWKALPAEEYHTPEGFDALKQKLGDIRDALPFNTPQRVVADQAYSAVRKTISEQAPGYDKVMADYSRASDAVSSIQKELSLGPKGNPGTAMRKLQSIMRDNANTSYGNRASFADQLEQNGATTLLPSLAGQSMSTLVPRGLARAVTSGEIGAALLNPVLATKLLPVLAASSPRLVGEAAHGLGRGVGFLGSLPRVAALSGAGKPTLLGAPALAAMLPRLAQ